jgi:hypothetical protein
MVVWLQLAIGWPVFIHADYYRSGSKAGHPIASRWRRIIQSLARIGMWGSMATFVTAIGLALYRLGSL